MPAVVSERNGSRIVTIRSPHNSIYALIEMNQAFADMQGHWAKADVELLANKLIVQGTPDHKFSPDSRITRAEFTALLVRALGLLEVQPDKPFTDVKADAWYAGAVGASQRAGLVTGNVDGSFLPEEDITREQMAAMIVRAVRTAGKDVAVDSKTLDKFNDRSEIASWAQDAAAQAVSAGIINGATDSTFAAKKHATRAESASMLKRMLQYVAFIN